MITHTHAHTHAHTHTHTHTHTLTHTHTHTHTHGSCQSRISPNSMPLHRYIISFLAAEIDNLSYFKIRHTAIPCMHMNVPVYIDFVPFHYMHMQGSALEEGVMILSMLAMDSTFVLMGTNTGVIQIFDGYTHKMKHKLASLHIPVLCMIHLK